MSLVELMVTLSVAAISLTLGVPSFNGLREGMQRSQASLGLMSAFTLARSEAGRRGVAVTVCPTPNGLTCSGADLPNWGSGWITFIDSDADLDVDGGEEVLDVAYFEESAFSLVPDDAVAKGVTLNVAGFPDSAGSFTYQDDVATCVYRLSPVGRIEGVTNDPKCR